MTSGSFKLIFYYLSNSREKACFFSKSSNKSHRIESVILNSVAWPHVSESRSVESDSLRPHGLYSPWNSPGQNTGVSSFSLLQVIFPTQRLNLGLPHCRQFLYQLSHKGSPRILQWVAYPFSRQSSQPRNRSGVSGIAGRYFTNWAIREAQYMNIYMHIIFIHN